MALRDLLPEPHVRPAHAAAPAVHRLARALAATALLLLGWAAAVSLCLEALLLADLTTALRVALVVVAAVPAAGAVVAARLVLGLGWHSHWVYLGLLPSLAGGYLLAGLL